MKITFLNLFLSLSPTGERFNTILKLSYNFIEYCYKVNSFVSIKLLTLVIAFKF